MPHDECDRGSAELIDGTLCSGRGPGIRAAVRSARAAAAPLRPALRAGGSRGCGRASARAAPRPRLPRCCLRLATSVVEAGDCFQETFLRLHRARATYVTGANPLHWAFAIARSVYWTRLRSWRRRPEQLGASRDIAEAGELQAHDTTPEAEVSAQHLHA